METTNEIPVYTLAQFLKYDKSNTRGASTRGCVRDIDKDSGHDACSHCINVHHCPDPTLKTIRGNLNF